MLYTINIFVKINNFFSRFTFPCVLVASQEKRSRLKSGKKTLQLFNSCEYSSYKKSPHTLTHSHRLHYFQEKVYIKRHNSDSIRDYVHAVSTSMTNQSKIVKHTTCSFCTHWFMFTIVVV